jgi:hypothetical protein
MALLRDRYELGARLGDGVFARTHAGRDLQTGGEVVIKEVTVKGLPDWKPVELLEREARALAGLEHPGVPRLVDAFQEDLPGEGSVMYLVVERVAGETLGALIGRGHRWTEAAARRLLEALLDTLAYLHGLSPPVVHRDIKPSNIVVRPDGAPVLVDFGAVRDLAARSAGGGLTVVGTAGYMPPEQAMGRAMPASDLFALGATMVHALSHHHPAELPRDGLSLRFDDLVGVPPPFVRILEKMLEPDLKRRYQRAADVLSDLRAGDVLAIAPAPPPPAQAGPETTAIAARAPAAIAAAPVVPRPVTPAIERKLRQQMMSRLGTSGVGAAIGATVITSTVGAPLIARFVFGSIDPASFMLTVASMLTLAAGVNLGLLGRLRASLRAIWKRGKTVDGRVRAITVDTYDMRKARIAYTFEVENIPYAGTLVTSDAGDLHAATVGGPVLIVYDPAHPHRHVAMLEPSARVAIPTT